MPLQFTYFEICHYNYSLLWTVSFNRSSMLLDPLADPRIFVQPKIPLPLLFLQLTDIWGPHVNFSFNSLTCRVLPVLVLLLKLCVWLLLRSPPDRAPSIEIHVELKGVLSLSEFLCFSSSSHRDRDTHYSICYHYCTARFKRSLVNLYDIHCWLILARALLPIAIGVCSCPVSWPASYLSAPSLINFCIILALDLGWPQVPTFFLIL